MAEKDIISAEIVKTPTGRQYHINLAPGELAENILLCGEPERVERASKFFEKIELKLQNREFVTHTGYYKGSRISVMSTGIGPDNIEIALIEIFQITNQPTIIRIGSSGALQPDIEVGDLVISTGAVRLENTSTFFVPDGYPAFAHHEVILALISAAEKLHYRYHIGITATACGFYGAQGRRIPGIPLRYPNLQDDLAVRNVVNFEMESSTLFILAALKKIRAGTVCAVYANRPKNVFIKSSEKLFAEERCIKTGLEAFAVLKKIDLEKEKAHKKCWSLWMR